MIGRTLTQVRTHGFVPKLMLSFTLAARLEINTSTVLAGNTASQPRLSHQNHGFPGSLFAVDAGIFLNPGDFVCGADHPDPASYSQICLYAPRGRSGRRSAFAVRLADRQLFQRSDHGPAGQAVHVGPAPS